MEDFNMLRQFKSVSAMNDSIFAHKRGQFVLKLGSIALSTTARDTSSLPDLGEMYF